jgi:hypothetical protein
VEHGLGPLGPPGSGQSGLPEENRWGDEDAGFWSSTTRQWVAGVPDRRGAGGGAGHHSYGGGGEAWRRPAAAEASWRLPHVGQQLSWAQRIQGAPASEPARAQVAAGVGASGHPVTPVARNGQMQVSPQRAGRSQPVWAQKTCGESSGGSDRVGQSSDKDTGKEAIPAEGLQ